MMSPPHHHLPPPHPPRMDMLPTLSQPHVSRHTTACRQAAYWLSVQVWLMQSMGSRQCIVQHHGHSVDEYGPQAGHLSVKAVWCSCSHELHDLH